MDFGPFSVALSDGGLSVATSPCTVPWWGWAIAANTLLGLCRHYLNVRAIRRWNAMSREDREAARAEVRATLLAPGSKAVVHDEIGEGYVAASLLLHSTLGPALYLAVTLTWNAVWLLHRLLGLRLFGRERLTPRRVRGLSEFYLLSIDTQ